MGIVRAPGRMARRLVSAYSEKTYAVTSALVPISSNSGVSHSMAITSMAITSFHVDFIVQAHHVLTDLTRSPPSSPVNQATLAQGPLRTQPETFLLVRWVAYATQRTGHPCLFFRQREDEESVSVGRPEHTG